MNVANSMERRFFLSKNERVEIYGREIEPPVVDRDKCIGCGECVKVCPSHLLELREKKAEVVYGEACFACGHCWAVCPEEAITQNEVETKPSDKPGDFPAVSPDLLKMLLRERRSIRLFRDKPIPKDVLEQIVDAGRYGPTASNRQDVNYIVLSSKEKVNELRTLVEGFMAKTSRQLGNPLIGWLYSLKFGRPGLNIMRHYIMAFRFLEPKQDRNAYIFLPYGAAVMVVHARSFDIMAHFNCAVALYNCSLMAHSLGLGSCFTGFLHAGANMDKKIRSWLKIPGGHQCFGAMVLGYPDVKYRRLIERRKQQVQWV